MLLTEIDFFKEIFGISDCHDNNELSLHANDQNDLESKNVIMVLVCVIYRNRE